MSFFHHLVEGLVEGDISEEVALEFASNPEALKMNLRGIFLDSGKRIVS